MKPPHPPEAPRIPENVSGHTRTTFPLRPSTIPAGPYAWSGFWLGIGGMILFGIYHWFFVIPVTAVFLEGILWGGGAGALVGLAYHRAIIQRNRSGWRWSLAFGMVFVLALIPYEAIGLIWGPFAEIQRPRDILPMLPLTLAGVGVLILGGWLLTRNRRGTALITLAGFVLHFFIGGSAAFFGGRGQTLILVLIMAGYELLAALLLPLLAHQIAAKRRGTPSAPQETHRRPDAPP